MGVNLGAHVRTCVGWRGALQKEGGGSNWRLVIYRGIEQIHKYICTYTHMLSEKASEQEQLKNIEYT